MSGGRGESLRSGILLGLKNSRVTQLCVFSHHRTVNCEMVNGVVGG